MTIARILLFLWETAENLTDWFWILHTKELRRVSRRILKHYPDDLVLQCWANATDEAIMDRRARLALYKEAFAMEKIEREGDKIFNATVISPDAKIREEDVT